jgi:hypothetical protein
MAQLRYSENVKFSGKITHSIVPIEFIIPEGAIVLYNGSTPSIPGWQRYTAADGLLIIGTSVQSNVALANTVGGIGAQIEYTYSAEADHPASPGGLTAYIGEKLTIISTPGTFDSQTNLYPVAHSHNTNTTFGPPTSGSPLTFTYDRMPNGAKPNTSNITLIQAISASNTFPASVIHINNIAVRNDWTQMMAPASGSTTYASARYICGGNGVAHNDANSHNISMNTGYGGSHDHGFSGGNQRTSNPPNSPTGAFNTYIGATPFHVHSFTSNAQISALKARIVKLWTAAYNHKLSNTTNSNLVIMYSGDIAFLPSYWKVCDGTNGTMDMRDYFLGYSTESANLTHATVQTANVSFANVNTGVAAPETSEDTFSHTHQVAPNPVSFATPAGHTTKTVAHRHTVFGRVFSDPHIKPPHIYLSFIQFMPS